MSYDNKETVPAENLILILFILFLIIGGIVLFIFDWNNTNNNEEDFIYNETLINETNYINGNLNCTMQIYKFNKTTRMYENTGFTKKIYCVEKEND